MCVNDVCVTLHYSLNSFQLITQENNDETKVNNTFTMQDNSCQTMYFYSMYCSMFVAWAKTFRITNKNGVTVTHTLLCIIPFILKQRKTFIATHYNNNQKTCAWRILNCNTHSIWLIVCFVDCILPLLSYTTSCWFYVYVDGVFVVSQDVLRAITF